ncbi:MAG TPA: DoxX-like family protein, partial [Beijerinckiaceae bacterium]
LYLLKPVAFTIFVVFWIMTGVISLTIGWEIGKGLMFEGGVPDPWASLVVVAGALADICIGLAIAWRRTTKWGLWAAFAISVAYTFIGSALVPALWAEPLGPMLKIWPIMAFNLMLLAILRDR